MTVGPEGSVWCRSRRWPLPRAPLRGSAPRRTPDDRCRTPVTGDLLLNYSYLQKCLFRGDLFKRELRCLCLGSPGTDVFVVNKKCYSTTYGLCSCSYANKLCFLVTFMQVQQGRQRRSRELCHSALRLIRLEIECLELNFSLKFVFLYLIILLYE